MTVRTTPDPASPRPHPPQKRAPRPEPPHLGPAADRRGPAPLLVWAVLGVAFLLLTAWTLGRWALDGNLYLTADTDVGVSTGRAVALRTIEVITFLMLTAMLWMTVRRAWQLRVLTFELMTVVACAHSSWQDPLLSTAAQHNHFLLHFPGWGEYLPFYELSNSHEVATMLALMGYVVMMVTVFPVSMALVRLSRRRPRWGKVRLYLVAGTLCTLGMAVLEGIVNVWGGVYTWGGLRPEVSFFPGTWHQYSPLEPIAFGFLFGASVAMAHSTVLNGGSPKFLDGLPEVTGRRRAALRQLAVLGFVNSAILLYNLAVIIQSVPRQWIPGLPKMFLG